MLDNIEWVDERDPAPPSVQQRYIALPFAGFDVSDQSPTDWNCLLNKVQGAAALPHILDGTLKHLIDSTDFEHDPLFCEGLYMVDWEKKEVYVRGGEFNPVEETLTFAELTEERILELGERRVEEENEKSGENEEKDEKDEKGKGNENDETKEKKENEEID